jgi:hypothetical protein
MAAKKRQSRRMAMPVAAAAATIPAAVASNSITVQTGAPLASDSETRRVELNARNNDELRSNAQNILAMIQEGRPKNTTAAYKPKQKEFKTFCARKQYHDGDTVTEDKILLFLVEDVANRPLRAKSRKAAKETLQGDTRLAWRSVRGYVTAVTDLYRSQKALGMNIHPSPREANVKEYLRSLQRRDAQEDKTNYADKGRDTLLDGYTEQEFERVCHELWAHSGAGPECHLRTLVDLLLGHYLLTRGGDRRAAEISDLFTFEFEEEGPTRCMPLIFTTRAGKQNQHGRLETAGALRNKKPAICMLSGLAFYLLYRWDLSAEAFPDFSRQSAWYDIRLIKGCGIDRTTDFSYNSQREWVSKAFAYAKIVSRKKTHVGRSSGAKTAELKGVSEDQIRRAGRWNQEQMIGCYLNALPRKYMRMMAGHPQQKGCFEIRRAGATPPNSLLSMIWPQLDRWKGRFGLAPGQTNDLAAMGFTNLLLYLREVILQDSVVLMKQFPESLVWSHPVFQHTEYQQFAQEVSTLVQQEVERPSQLDLLVQAVPVLANYLQSIEGRIADLKTSLQTSLKTELQATEKQRIESQTLQLQTLLSAGLTFELKTTGTSTNLLQLQPAIAPTAIVEEAQSRYESARSTPVRSTAPAPASEEEPPQYRMCRAIKIVEDLWREWTVGLQGQPAIAALDSRWGSRWRAGRQSELQWYSLRLEVIKEIRRLAQAQRSSEQAAMCALGLRQQQIGCSLDQFCKLLRANRKARLARLKKAK